MFIVDAHLDLAYNALRHGRDLLQPIADLRTHEFMSGAQSRRLNGTALVTIPALRDAGVGIVFGSLFVAPISRLSEEPDSRFIYRTSEEAFKLAMEQLDYYHRLADEVDYIRLVTDRTSLKEVLESRLMETEPLLGIVPMMEGADPVRHPVELEMWYERGLRIVAPAWDDTRYSAGAWRGHGGLTGEGRQLLEVMADLGIILDLSHMSQEASLQALDSFEGRLVASHSNARYFVNTQRQLADQQIGLISERSGVIGVVMFNKFLKKEHERGDPKEAVTIDHVVAHIDHICQCAGDSLHTGLGTDFDGGFGQEDVPAEIKDVSDLALISTALAKRGYSPDDVENIMGLNWVIILKDALPK